MTVSSVILWGTYISNIKPIQIVSAYGSPAVVFCLYSWLRNQSSVTDHDICKITPPLFVFFLDNPASRKWNSTYQNYTRTTKMTKYNIYQHQLRVPHNCFHIFGELYVGKIWIKLILLYFLSMNKMCICNIRRLFTRESINGKQETG
jgi:hypothetical protein